MTYTVQQLASLSGVSVRTLHYYDEIGLFRPSFYKDNGYRYYEEKELIRLQQILFFRELEFSLEQIQEMLNAPNFDSIQALEDQKKLIELKRTRLSKLIKTITNSIITMKQSKKVNDQELYGSLTKKQIDDYKEEVRAKYGADNPAVRQSEERTKNWKKADYDRIQQQVNDITQDIAAAMDLGPQSDEVQKHIHRHYEYVSQFYECSYEMFQGLGKMYVEDKRFTAFYEKYKKGLAQFMCEAMTYYCEVRRKK